MKMYYKKKILFLLLICVTNVYAQKEINEETKTDDYVILEDVKFYNHEKEIDSKIGNFYFQFNDGYDENDNDILKLTVTQIFKKSEQSKTENLLPTLFLIPGGGFTSVLPSDFINADNCTGKSLATQLADQGYNVFVLNYQVATGIEKLLLDLSLAHVCNTTVSNTVKHLQQKTSYRSFWSLRKVIREKTSTSDSLNANNIDIDNMIMVGHSAGGFLTLYSLFLDQTEIPSTICSLADNACNIPSNWRNQHWPMPKMKGYISMSGATFNDDIFLNDTTILGDNGPNLLLMHGTCDELVNQYHDYVPSKCRIGDISSLNMGYSKNYSNPDKKFNKVFGSGYIFQQLYTKMKRIRFEQVCDGGHSINNVSINYPFTTQASNPAVLFGQWNTCDLDDPTGPISTQHLLFNRINDFIQRTLYSNPGPLSYELQNTAPELPSQKCLNDDRGDVTPITGITNTGCSLSLIGGEGALLYIWYIYNIGSPPQLLTIAPTLDVSHIPSGTWNVIGAAANACDIEYFSYPVEFSSCSSARSLPKTSINYHDRYFLLDIDHDDEGILTLLDLNGKVITKREFNVNRGVNKINIEEVIKNLSAGIYILNFSNSRISVSTKFFYN